MPTRRNAWLIGAAVGVAVVVTALPACSSGASPARGTAVEVTLKDFHVHVSSSGASSGLVSFDIDNRGPSTHEFVVVGTGVPAAALPLEAGRLTVDESSSALQDVDEIPDLDIGDSAMLSVHLAPGRYVLFCNLEGHYLGGMYTSFVVT